MGTSTSSLRPGKRALAALLCLCFALTPSCRLISGAANAPSKLASGLTGGGKPSDRVPPNIVQGGVMRFADTFAARITQATQEFAAKAGTPEARIQALSWSIGQNTSAFIIATGINARVSLLDMIVLVTLGRMVHEGYWMPKVYGDADLPMVEAFQASEEDVWQMADQVLSPEQQEEVRAVLNEWREQNPDMGITAFVRLPEFQDLLKASAATGAKTGGGLGELLSVDPLGGLEPAVREIEQTRLFAERTMFYMQRVPILLSSQVELLSLKLMRLPEVHSALEVSERISQAAASISATAAALPESVRVERDAAVKQISGEIALQRQGLISDLDKAEEPTRKILNDARATLEAGTQLSAALQSALVTLDTFIGRFDKPPPVPGAPPAPPKPPGKPFDITEYGAAATQLTAAVHELNGLVASLDQNLPQVQRMLDEVAARGDRTIDHAFTRGLQFGGLLVAAAALAVLIVRWISARFVRTRA